MHRHFMRPLLTRLSIGRLQPVQCYHRLRGETVGRILIIVVEEIAFPKRQVILG